MFWTWSERNYPLKNTKWQEVPATQTSFLIFQFFHNNYQENTMGKVTVEGFICIIKRLHLLMSDTHNIAPLLTISNSKHSPPKAKPHLKINHLFIRTKLVS